MKFPIFFYNHSHLDYKVDKFEQIGNICMEPFCIGFGKCAVVIQLDYNIIEFETQIIPLYIRITVIALVVLFTPITIPLYIIGNVCLRFSNTYEERLSLFLTKEGFIKTHERSKCLFNPEEYQTVIDQIPILKTPFFLNLITEYTNQKKLKLSDYNNKTSLEILCHLLTKGCCYGQSMAILKILSDPEKQAIICENTLLDLIQSKDYVYYQVLHRLHVFLFNSSENRFIYGIDVQESIKTLEALFPFHQKRKIISEEFSLNDSIEIIKIRLSDFIKHNASSLEKTTQNFVITTSFEGHIATIYYNSTNKIYYWYDPYSTNDGLFSSKTCSIFLTGVAEKMKLHSKDYSICKFTAFDLTSA